MNRCHLLLCATLLSASWADADEGMWLYDQPPLDLLKTRYDFEPSAAWLEHLQKSSANVGGASGSFVSADGLLLSNHHVVSRVLQRMSTAERNLVQDGFYARTRESELPCPGLEVSVLIQIEDVTGRVNAAVPENASDDAAFRARRGAMAAIEAEAAASSGLRCQVITLFQGGQYHLYKAKRYTDVRLVFAPEEQIAFFGGDVDNFEFPRWNLDIVFLRAYENGKPARIQHFLRWSKPGPGDGDLVFMSGHPARTDRLRTAAELKYLRDVEYPRALQRLKRTEVLLAAYSKESIENARRARSDLRGVENGRKRRDGTLAGLLDPALIKRKEAEEARLLSAAQANPALASAADAWDRIAKAQKQISERSLEYDLLESGNGFNSLLFTHARRLLRAAAECEKPEGERLDEYRASSLPSIELSLAAQQPFYNDLETLKLADSLTYLAEQLGPDHHVTTKILSGKSPRERAAECVAGTRLASASVRKQLFADGPTARASKDAMIELARCIDSESRSVRSVIEAQTEAIRQAHAQIGKVRYEADGPTRYPDATGTLRLAFGKVEGIHARGLDVPHQTTFAGLYKRASARGFWPPFDLPERWVRSRGKLSLAAPLNFVSTCDTLGGNSGSPVVNAQGELVGVVFDGNIHSLILDVEYEQTRARSVAVHSTGIIEALQKVYRAEELIREIQRGSELEVKSKSQK